MNQRFFIILTVVVLAVCLLSGGCQPSAEQSSSIKSWRDLVNLLPEPEGQSQEEPPEPVSTGDPEPNMETGQETIEVMLYFGGQDGSTLVPESRVIPKEVGIARSTINELFKGPETPGYLSVVPEGTRLLDINVKPDGLCIVDMSHEARQVANKQQEEMMVMAIVNTIGQFPTVKEVTFRINGEPVQEIGGFMDLSQPIKPAN
ncbi:MAG TPA: GerMN domain-containing protein [Syntrophomonadaceae bacterium]|nr:GerMN domain-containing protein [Syntrophomonadaceae bacterium]HOQ09480.1 GerMN domain-containing protein [Syntrophomonadaceae bacterium]HPU48446.1 GerMN domain-containing protein [Syntrophomonadaceae bacterium]